MYMPGNTGCALWLEERIPLSGRPLQPEGRDLIDTLKAKTEIRSDEFEDANLFYLLCKVFLR